jgi:hypothetical protein
MVMQVKSVDIGMLAALGYAGKFLCVFTNVGECLCGTGLYQVSDVAVLEFSVYEHCV